MAMPDVACFNFWSLLFASTPTLLRHVSAVTSSLCWNGRGLVLRMPSLPDLRHCSQECGAQY
eukprot:4820653-Pleurochrysis_carterae.AAC.8